MFVLRFHNTFLLKLGILELFINLALLFPAAIAADSDSKVELTAYSAIETVVIKAIEQEAKRLQTEHHQALRAGGKSNWTEACMADAVTKTSQFFSYLMRYPGLFDPSFLKEIDPSFLMVAWMPPALISILLTKPECKHILRTYRFTSGASLIQYYADGAIEVGGQCILLFDQFISSYLADIGEISEKELDLKVPVDFNIFNPSCV